jgi:hypothetical protein
MQMQPSHVSVQEVPGRSGTDAGFVALAVAVIRRACEDALWVGEQTSADGRRKMAARRARADAWLSGREDEAGVLPLMCALAGLDADAVRRRCRAIQAGVR